MNPADGRNAGRLVNQHGLGSPALPQARGQQQAHPCEQEGTPGNVDAGHAAPSAGLVLARRVHQDQYSGLSRAAPQWPGRWAATGIEEPAVSPTWRMAIQRGWVLSGHCESGAKLFAGFSVTRTLPPRAKRSRSSDCCASAIRSKSSVMAR